MQFEDRFEVAGSPALVIDKLADVPLMAGLVPGASVGPANPDGSYPASLLVAFGPKRLTFKGTVRNEVDRAALSGVLTGSASADVRGAKMTVTMRYGLAGCPGAQPPRTEVRFVSEAQLTGILAEFASTGGVVVTKAILAEFSRRFSAQFAPPPGAPAPAAADDVPPALSAAALAAAILNSITGAPARAARRLWQRLRRPRRA